MCQKRHYVSADGPARFFLHPAKPTTEIDASYFRPRTLQRNEESAAANEAIFVATGEIVRVVGRIVCECTHPSQRDP